MLQLPPSLLEPFSNQPNQTVAFDSNPHKLSPTTVEFLPNKSKRLDQTVEGTVMFPLGISTVISRDRDRMWDCLSDKEGTADGRAMSCPCFSKNARYFAFLNFGGN